MTRHDPPSSPVPSLSPAEFHILMTLVGGDRHGYGIMQEVEADTGRSVRLGPGTLYGALKRLLDSGCICLVEDRVDPELDDSRRKYYRLTPRGREAVRVEAARLESLVRLARRKSVLDPVTPTPSGASP